MTTCTTEAAALLGVPGIDDDLRHEIAGRSDLPDEPPHDIEAARVFAHAAMRRHPSRSGIVTANAIAARMLVVGVVSPALLDQAVQWYARSVARTPGGVCHRHRWLERGRWRDALAGLAVELREAEARERAAIESAGRPAEIADADQAERERDERVRQALIDMGPRAMQALASRRLEALRVQAAAGDREAGGLLAWLRREPVEASSRSWRSALATMIGGGE